MFSNNFYLGIRWDFTAKVPAEVRLDLRPSVCRQ